MVLIIQETTNQLDKIRQQIQETWTILETDCIDKEKLRDWFLECDQYKEKIEMEIRTIKKNKFKRDAEDYRLGRVYSWRNASFKTQKRFPRQHASMETDSETQLSTASSSSSSF